MNSLLQGKAALAGNIPPTQSAFGITEKELITFPGYLEDRAKEEAEAKKMWDANGGPGLARSSSTSRTSGRPLLRRFRADHEPAEEGPRNTFTAKIEPLFHHHQKLVKQQYGNRKNNIWYGWITEISDPEPTLLNHLQRNSSAPSSNSSA
ncbi:MAG: hypothetical protein IPO51_11760 [Dehalococcoidia bacterium]|nr:hypothetical protein [Dehalococcoidia bacterium]